MDSIRCKTGEIEGRGSDCPPNKKQKMVVTVVATVTRKKKKSDKPPAEKAIRICLFLTRDQDTVLKQWFGTARWTYNCCLDAVKRRGVKLSKKALHATCLNRDTFEGKEDLKWVLNTPYDV